MFFNEFQVSMRSSAKCSVENSTVLWKLLIKRIKRIGPDIDSWGPPTLTGLSESDVS